MTEPLAKIEKPSAEEFRTGRKLLFVPLIFSPREAPPDFTELVNHYWEQVEAQISKLEATLSVVHKVYHELIPVGGKEGLKAIKELNCGSYPITRTRLKNKAKLQPVEDSELLMEFMDWSKCLSIGLQSLKAITLVYKAYPETQKKRNLHITKQIDKTLKTDETALLLMQEDHQIQFPSDIQVFYVAPPSLDEIKRWLRDRPAEAQTPEAEAQT